MHRAHAINNIIRTLTEKQTFEQFVVDIYSPAIHTSSNVAAAAPQQTMTTTTIGGGGSGEKKAKEKSEAAASSSYFEGAGAMQTAMANSTADYLKATF